jgi:hypothetical protein
VRRASYHLALILLSLLTLAFFAFLLRAWFIHTQQPVLCQLHFGQLDDRNGYLEIQLTRQHPVEPYFEGQFFLVSVDPQDAAVSSVRVTRSAEKTYGRSEIKIPMVWDQEWNALRAVSPQRFDLITMERSHAYFPWDSATFEFDLTFNPVVTNFKGLRLVNHVPGFVLRCAECRATKSSNGQVHILFLLDRSPLIQLTVYVVAAAPIIFILLIMSLTQVESVVVSVASYFVSIWSLRGILSEPMKTFPTLFDCWLLSMSMIMIIFFLWKIIRLKGY